MRDRAKLAGYAVIAVVGLLILVLALLALGWGMHGAGG